MAVKVIAQFRPGYPQSSSAVQAPMWIDITSRIDFQNLQWEQQATDKNTSLRFDIFTFFPLSTTRYDEYASWISGSAPASPEDIDTRLSDAIHDTSFFIDLTNRAEVKLLYNDVVVWGGVVSSVNTERSGSSFIVQQVEALDYTALLDEVVVRDYNAPNVSEAIGELPTEAGLTSQVITGGSQLIAGPYTFRVIAVDGSGDPLTIFTHITQYITPSDVAPADNTDTPLRTIELTWDAVAGVDEYLVYAKQGIGTTNLYRQSTIAAGTTTYSLSTIPVTNTVVSPEQYVQKGSVDVDIISGSSDSNNANYKGIFNAIDPALDPGINNFTYVKPAKALADGTPDPDASFRFSPVLETGVILTSPFGGKTLKQAMKTISDKTGSIFWVDAAKNLHYANKKAEELVQNPRFDSSSTKWTLGTNHTIQPSRGPFGFGNALVASGSSSTNQTKSDPITVSGNTTYMPRVRGWADANFASSWDCELRFYSDAAGLTQVGSSNTLSRSVSFDGTDEQRWCKAWAIAKSHATAVSARFIAKRKSGATGACAWTDFSLIEVTGAYGFSDRPSESQYPVPLRGFETPKAPREASGIANRLLVYGVYKDPTNTNELESVEYNAGLALTKAQGGSLAANTYWVRVVAQTPTGDVYVKYDTEIITDADVAAPTPVRTLSANWSAVPTATGYKIYIGAGRMTMRLKATQVGTSITITSLPGAGALLSGEPDVYYYKTFDFAPGLWESGGKVVEASLNDQLVDSEAKAEIRALGFWEEKGIAMRTWEFDHLEEAPEVGTVIPFIWAADDIAEPLIVKGTKGKFLGDRIFWTTTLGSDPSLIKKGVTQIFADLKQATLRLNDVLPPARPSNLALTAPSGSLIQTVDGVTRATVIAKWTPSQEDDFSNYVVQYGYDVNFANAQVINVAQTPEVRSVSTGIAAQVTHSFQAEPGKKLFFRVAAQDRTGNRSDFVDDSVILPADTTAPDAPTGVTVTASLKSMAIAWGFGFYDPSLPDQNTNNTDFTRFKVYRKQYNAGTNPNEPWLKIAETSTNVYIDTSFLNYTNLYQYKVSAVDRTGNESAAVQETTPTYRSPNKITGTVDIEDATITSAQISSLTANLITAGTLNISTGMSVISDGTATLPQFEVDKDGVTIRDDAGNIVLEVNGSTANLNADFLNVTGIEATEITVGTGGSVVRVGNYPTSVSPTFQGIWGGAANPSSAAFTLATSGAVTASNLTATGGAIGGWLVGATTISSSTGNVFLNNNGIITAGSTSTSQAHMSGDGFWAGASSSSSATAPFRVSSSGGVTAANISIIGGTLSVGDVPISIAYLSRAADGIVTIKTSSLVSAVVGQYITVDVTSAPWASDADFNGAFRIATRTSSAPYTITYVGATASAVTEVAATGSVFTGAKIFGESASGTWFTVNEGFALKNPANVSQNIITASASNVSINADFINAGSVSLGNLGANAIQSTNFSVSNTGTITAQDGTVGGWALAATKLFSGTSTSYVALATSGGYSIYAGHETPSLAPFSVTPGGSIYAKVGTIGGWSLGEFALTAGSGSSRAGVATSGGYAFYAGDEDPALAEFSVTPAGALTASNITATGGTIGGWSLASSRLYASATSGATTKFYGVVADPVLLGRAFFAGATNSAGDGSVFEVLNDGSVIANNLSITGGPAAGNVISVNSGTFSVTSAGAMTATSATVSGSVTATSGSIGGWSIYLDRIYNSGVSKFIGLVDSAADGDVAIFAGATASTGAGATFSVTNSGILSASGATISGAITATSGSIGGWSIGLDKIYNSGVSKFIGLVDAAADADVAIFAGATNSTGSGATFTVTNAGAVTASSGTIAGWSIASDRIWSGSGSSYVGMSTGATAFFSGANTSSGGSALFSVTNAGALTATNATLSSVSVNPASKPALMLQGAKNEGDIAVPSSSTATITTYTRTTAEVTLTTSANHNFAAGANVTITGSSVAAFNSTFVITAVTQNTFTFVLAGTAVVTPTSSGGTASSSSAISFGVYNTSTFAYTRGMDYLPKDSDNASRLTIYGSDGSASRYGSLRLARGDGSASSATYGTISFNGSSLTFASPLSITGGVVSSGEIKSTSGSIESGVNGTTRGSFSARGDGTNAGYISLYSGVGSAGGTLSYDIANGRLSMNNDLYVSGALEASLSFTAGTSIYAGGSGGNGNVYAGFLNMGDDPGIANTADQQGISLKGSSTSGYAIFSRAAAAQTDSAIWAQADYLSGTWSGIQFRRMLASGAVYSNTGVINVAASTTTAPSFASASDYRMKTNIRDASSEIDMLDKIISLRPVIFDNSVDPESPLKYNQLGFIAHEVQPIVPQAVTGEKDAVDADGNPIYQNLSDARFIPYLVGAIKELAQQNTALKARITALEGA